MKCLTAHQSSNLNGIIRCPGDKSISHRSLILGALSMGETKIEGLLIGEDVMATAEALRHLGVQITAPEINDKGLTETRVIGVGLGGFERPSVPLDLGNSGTGVRLLMGTVAGSGIGATFVGDQSLSARPMRRIIDPLIAMGAQITARNDTNLPVTILGTNAPLAISWDSPVASAQIKSAILLAGLTARGTTIVREPSASRDHTEKMLRHFGVEVTSTYHDDGSYEARVMGEAKLDASDVFVPSDPSSAAFPIAAALICADSAVTVNDVSLNPLRCGFFETLIEMGADIEISNRRETGGEVVGDITARSSSLKGVEIPALRSASMIDEYPILAVVAAFAKGETRMVGIGELRHKETDRIEMMAQGLIRSGVSVTTGHDSMTVSGGGQPRGGITIDAGHDHRIAMTFLILGLAVDAPITVAGAETIETSFPQFAEKMGDIGTRIEESIHQDNTSGDAP